MGFPEVWKLFDDLPEDEKHNFQSFLMVDAAEVADGNIPWLVIDSSNITGFLCNSTGGHYASTARYYRSFWRSIFSSGYRIKLVKDGSRHDAARGCIKLDRMLGNSDVSRNNIVTFNSVSDIYYILKEEMKRQRAGTKNPLVVEEVRAMQEADTYIRQFAREQSSSVRVTIMSNDTSLLLALPDNVSICNLTRLSLVAHPSLPEADPLSLRLFGATIGAVSFSNLLAQQCKKNLLSLQQLMRPKSEEFRLQRELISFIDSVPNCHKEFLVMVACLVSGEHSSVDNDESSDPYRLLSFMTNFMFPFNHPLRNKSARSKKMCTLVVYGVLVFNYLYVNRALLPIPTPERCFSRFRTVIEAVMKAARDLNTKTSAAAGVFVLQIGRTNAANFAHVCTAAAGINVDAMLTVLDGRLKSALDLPEPPTPHPPPAPPLPLPLPPRGGATSGASLPTGLSLQSVPRATASHDMSAPSASLYKSKWRDWITYEMEEDSRFSTPPTATAAGTTTHVPFLSGVCLNPFFSLIEQICEFSGDFRQTLLTGEVEAGKESAVAVAYDCISSAHISPFNTWIRTLLSYLTPPPQQEPDTPESPASPQTQLRRRACSYYRGYIVYTLPSGIPTFTKKQLYDQAIHFQRLPERGCLIERRDSSSSGSGNGYAARNRLSSGKPVAPSRAAYGDGPAVRNAPKGLCWEMCDSKASTTYLYLAQEFVAAAGTGAGKAGKKKKTNATVDQTPMEKWLDLTEGDNAAEAAVSGVTLPKLLMDLSVRACFLKKCLLRPAAAVPLSFDSLMMSLDPKIEQLALYIDSFWSASEQLAGFFPVESLHPSALYAATALLMLHWSFRGNKALFGGGPPKKSTSTSTNTKKYATAPMSMHTLQCMIDAILLSPFFAHQVMQRIQVEDDDKLQKEQIWHEELALICVGNAIDFYHRDAFRWTELMGLVTQELIYMSHSEFDAVVDILQEEIEEEEEEEEATSSTAAAAAAAMAGSVIANEHYLHWMDANGWLVVLHMGLSAPPSRTPSTMTTSTNSSSSHAASTASIASTGTEMDCAALASAGLVNALQLVSVDDVHHQLKFARGSILNVIMTA
mmetsp:Transcript_28252/g.47531  ORF Transcript_28252/g.47531 Transcript_28252/m.47531 type:complete len:1085 (+) Transcript_28252:31-3285(+)